MSFRAKLACLAICALGTTAMAQMNMSAPADAPDAVDQNAPMTGDAYALSTCPISGQKLGMMGDPISKVYSGREVKFCCNGCVADFETDLDASWKKVDAKIIEDQLPHYPVDTCIFSGKPLTEEGEDIALNVVYNNRLIRVCCKNCANQVKQDPEAALAKLDAAVIAAQSKDYPLNTCAVRDDSKLGVMGDPLNIVVANRLVKLCCSGCKDKFDINPAKYIAKVDAAWEKSGKVMGHNMKPVSQSE